jgi:protocatechuate 3,4-dioxygenase beta subunit
MHSHHHDHDHDHDHDLAHDLNTLLKRRRSLLWLAAGAAVAPLLACGGGGDDSSTTSTTDDSSSTGSSGTSTCSVIPEETAGPYPGDGSNSNSSGVVNVLTLSGIVRSDIRTSIAGASGTAAGVPLTVTLTLVNTNSSCASLEGYAIYLWHCTRDGGYSLYSSGVTEENYLRGVQSTDSNGQVTFTTIFPACYAGRWPHIHFEVYPSLATATVATNKIKTSQIALPEAECDTVFATTGYGASVSNFNQVSLSTDNVFSDGATLETPTISGSVSAGYAIALNVGVAV